MKYMAIIDESQLNDVEKWDLIFEGKENKIAIKPIVKEMFVTKDGESVYLSDGHIKLFLDYEHKKMLEDILNKNPIAGVLEEWKGDTE